MSPKISVVIPIYRTEAFLEKCVQSVLKQTFDDIEVLCVDDQSPDSSAAIVTSIQQTDNRVKLIRHTENLGQGGARNTAIAQASGRYIANVDSDDWMKPTMLETLYQATNGETHDIVCCGYDRVDEDGQVIRQWSQDAAIYYPQSDHLDIFELLNPALWNKLIRKSLCTDRTINFPNYLNFEDLATTPRLVAEAGSIRMIEDRLYNYVRRGDSVVSTYTPKHMLDCFEAFGVLRRYLLEKNLLDKYDSAFRKMMHKHMAFRVNSIKRSALSDEQKHQHLKYYWYLKAAFFTHFDIVDSLDTESLINEIVIDPKAEVVTQAA